MAKKPTTKLNEEKPIVAKKQKTIEDFLFAFQGEKISIPRNGTGRSEKGKEYKYATLDDVISKTRDALQKHKLMFTQVIFQKENSETFLKTSLIAINATAEPKTIETVIPLGKPNSAQDMGSRITYMRRYALVPILGLSIEDDLDAIPPEMVPETTKTPSVEPEIPVKDIPPVPMPSQPNMPPLSIPSEPKEGIDITDRNDSITNSKYVFTSEKAKDKLQETIEQIQNEPAHHRSASHRKAFDLLGACQDENALQVIKDRIRGSDRLNAAEKEDLEKIIKLKETELAGTVHI